MKQCDQERFSAPLLPRAPGIVVARNFAPVNCAMPKEGVGLAYLMTSVSLTFHSRVRQVIAKRGHIHLTHPLLGSAIENFKYGMPPLASEHLRAIHRLKLLSS